MSSSALSAPLPRRGLVLGDLVPGTLTRDVALVVGGTLLMAASALVYLPVPGSPVPVTLQTFAALTVGAALGWQRAALSMLLYLGVGAVGVPWFAQGASGVGFPTFGYLVGFVLAGAAVGALASRGGDRSVLRTAGTMVLGNALIYAIGVPYLAWSLGISMVAAVSIGMTGYLLGDAVKVAMAAGLLPLTWRLMDRLHRD